MKKLFSLILVLGFLFGGVANSKIIEIDQGIKISIIEDYEHLQFNQNNYMIMNFKLNNVKETEIKKAIKYFKSLGFDGSETTTIIGRKGFSTGYASLVNAYKTKTVWSGGEQLSKNCSTKIIAEFYPCFIKHMKLDPLIQLDIGNGSASTEFKEVINSLKNNSFKKNQLIDRFKTVIGSTNINLKLNVINLKENNWGFEINGEDKDVVSGFKGKRFGYILPHNNSFLIVNGFCYSEKNCRNIKNTVSKIISPFLSLKKNTTVKNNVISLGNDLNRLNELYKSGALSKKEFEKAKKKLLN